MQIGIIGLGRMGANISRRLMRGGHQTVVYDIDAAARAELGSDGAAPAESLEAVVGQLSAPRAVWVMLPAGKITEDTIGRALYTAGIPDPDIIIRTSGEQRFSNFLLWQSAYAELVFVEENWPDFDEAAFVKVLEDYSGRDRRYGGVEARR